MLYFDHRDGKVRGPVEALEVLAARHDYAALLDEARSRWTTSRPGLARGQAGSPLRYAATWPATSATWRTR